MTSPSEYTPSTPSSKRSSFSTGSSLLPELDGPAQPLNRMGSDATTTSTISVTSMGVRADPLSLDFPPPTSEATVEEMLARSPQKWSLRHYLRDNAREAKVAIKDREAQARAFEDAKKELLKAKEELSLLANRGA